MKNIIELYRKIRDFKKGYQPGTNIVNDEKDDLVTDSHSILARWRDHFSQLFTVHGVNDVWQRDIHTAEPFEPEPSAFEVQLATVKLKRHKITGIDQSQQNCLRKARCITIRYEIHKPINSIWNKE
jgi:hypothetical protein